MIATPGSRMLGIVEEFTHPQMLMFETRPRNILFLSFYLLAGGALPHG